MAKSAGYIAAALLGTVAAAPGWAQTEMTTNGSDLQGCPALIEIIELHGSEMSPEWVETAGGAATAQDGARCETYLREAAIWMQVGGRSGDEGSGQRALETVEPGGDQAAAGGGNQGAAGADRDAFPGAAANQAGAGVGAAAGAVAGSANWRGDREPFRAPDVRREGFEPRQITALSIDDLRDAEVYDVNDNSLGKVEDIIVGGGGQLQHIVFDVGGFLGIGSRQVAVGFDEVTILSAANETGFRIYVDASEDQLNAMARAATN